MEQEETRWRMPRGLVAALLVAILLLAEITVTVFSVVPAVGRYGPHRSFPQVRDWSSLTITLSRSLCYGTCPSYWLEIHGDGTVLYNGTDCVAEKGRQTRRIERAAVASLVQKFRETDYFSLRDVYQGHVTDHPTYGTSISFDGRSKRVSDYAGGADGMPLAVNALEDAIDAVAGSEGWIYGGTRTCFGHPVDDSWRHKQKP
jgi:hypothetical protein